MLLGFDPMSLLTPDLGLVFWTTLVFLTFWLLVGKFAIKPITKAIKDREHTITDALSAAEKAKAEVQQMQANNASLLKEAREESAKILKEAKDLKESIVAEAHNSAKEEAAKIVASAKVEIDAQKKAAMAEVKNEVSKLSLEIAQKVLGRELDAAKDQQTYINSLVDKNELMSAEKLSKRYAKAIFDEAVSTGSLDAIYADLGLIDSTLKSSRELKAVFKNPVIKSHKKQIIVSQIFDGKINALTQKFLQLIVKEGRDNFMSEIIAAFFKSYNEVKGISEVTVTTATELDTASEQKIVDFIKTTSGYPNVKINKKIDTAILGGFVVDFGGKLYDNSVRYKLRKIEKEISLN